MSERLAFPLRYEENLVRSSLRGFMTSALFRDDATLTFTPLALIAFSRAMLFSSGDEEFAIELLLVSLVILAIFVVSGWRIHLRMLREKVERAAGRWPDFTTTASRSTVPARRPSWNGHALKRSGLSRAPGY